MEDFEQKVKQLKTEINKERAKLSTDRLDISFGELINLYKNKELIIRPEYQRLYRWSSNQKTAFIESILLSIPIPPIFVAEDQDGVWELVDGLQRVTTFISFFGELEQSVSNFNYLSSDIDEEELEVEIGNKWVLESGGIIGSLEGFNINTLPRNFQINLKRASCRVEILRGESNNTMKYELFKRLNSSGSKATPQEIRNAIFRGIDTRLNELLLELSQNTIFQKLIVLSKGKKQELYDQELILRFIAFYNNSHNVNKTMQQYLDNFMEKAVKNESFNYTYYKKLFLEVLGLLDGLDDLKVFRTSKNHFVPAEFDGITVGLAQNIEHYRHNKKSLREKVKALKTDEQFKKYSGTASASKIRTKKRLKRANEIFKPQS